MAILIAGYFMGEAENKKRTRLMSDSFKSGRRDSNPRPSAWKANALSTELLPQCNVDRGGQGWIRTTEGISQQIYSLPHLATLVLAPVSSLYYFFVLRCKDTVICINSKLNRPFLWL